MRHVSRLFNLLCVFCCVVMTRALPCAGQNTPSSREAALFAAIEKRDIARVRALLTQGVDVRVKDKDGFTPLHIAATLDSAIVRLLLEHGASVRDRDRRGSTPLLMAASDFSLSPFKPEIMQMLLDHGADINETDNDGYTTLHIGASQQSAYITKFALEHGADVQRRTKQGDTALILASNWMEIDAVYDHIAERGLETVQLLQAHGASLNAADNDGFTALMAAAVGGRDPILAFLLAKGADATQADKQGRNALTWAAWEGPDSANVRVLRKSGSPVGVTEALLLHDATLAQSLIVQRARTDVPAPREGMPIHLAAREGAGTVVRLLLDRGANVNAHNAEGETPLMLATGSQPQVSVPSFSTHWKVSKVQRGRAEIITMLLKRGAAINAQDKQDYTALMWAAAIGQEDAVGTLIAGGADVNLETRSGNTALQLAKKGHHETVVQRLKQAGAIEKTAP